MRLPLPRSLFARLMLIWMIGIALAGCAPVVVTV